MNQKYRNQDLGQMIQKNGNEDNLKNGPPDAWLGYSLLPEGNVENVFFSSIFHQVQISSFHFFSPKTLTLTWSPSSSPLTKALGRCLRRTLVWGPHWEINV